MDEFDFENFDCLETNTELGYEFKKEIASNTQAKAYHLKIDGINYQVVCAPYPRLYTIVAGYSATRTGKIENHEKPIFQFRSNKIEEGVIELLKIKKLGKEALLEKINMM